MTVYNSLKCKNIDEFAEWLDKYASHCNPPWDDWFDKNYCKKCDGVEYEGITLGWCELNGKCKFFQDMNDTPTPVQVVKMWLESEI